MIHLKLYHSLTLWPLIELWLYKKSRGLVFRMLSFWLRKEIKHMAFSKSIALGSVGSLVLAEAAGAASVTISASESLAGGVASVQASASGVVQDAELVQLVLDYMKAKIPSAATLISDLESVAIPALKSV